MKYLLVSTIIVIISFGFAVYVNAQTPAFSEGNTVSLPPPIENAENPNLLIGQAINGILGIVGSLALVMFVYGGILWMTAAGNDQRVTKGKETLLWAVIGLILIFSSYAIINFVLAEVIGGGSTSNNQPPGYMPFGGWGS